ncbi:M20 metallopeptidase family protein [Gudongella oleilytica]|jgi:amidohydrolase|uniref:M20 metallopeptidase family protein n=1 Tax=Gudongella oleilytica TaxID=1582259 RepID=UPI000ED4FFBD|nr:M20 family metallopeptidase [Gudongella oleilytica]MDY0257683.1 M20 family metallopeptidase [Gudongella oleilytica]HCO18923.1 amidohydrolase [Tissierellales bacterium]
MTDYLKQAKNIESEIIANRRTIHTFAEIGFQLDKTVEYVEAKLKEYGLEPKRSGKAGVTALVGKPGNTILLRADMDALPMKEETGLEFASETGNCHSCGHDCHTAMLLGAAKLLKDNEDELDGTVKLMFQPAEELLAGAVDMIGAGILEDPKVDAALAIHIYVGNELSKSGTVAYAKGPALFSGDAIKITIKGQNAHGSTPEKGIDAINIAAHTVIALQEIIARETSCMDNSVVLVGKIYGGDTVNTLAGNAVLEVSVRATTQDNREFLIQRIREIAESVAGTFRGEAIVEHQYGMGPLYNDPALSEDMAGYCEELLGEGTTLRIPLAVGTEDFTSIASRVPSVMLNLGMGSIDEGYTYSMHNPSMVVNEEVLHKGAAIYAYGAMRYLKKV